MVPMRLDSQGVLLGSPEHALSTLQHASQPHDGTTDLRLDIGSHSPDYDDGLRVVKKRRIGSLNPEDDVIRSLPQLPDGSQDVSGDSSSIFENVARIARAFEGGDHPMPPSSYNPHPGIVDLARHGRESDVRINGHSPTPTPKPQVAAKVVSRMKLDSLPILDNLATQILSTIAKSSYHDMVNLLSHPDSEAGQEYAAVLDLFNHTKRVYSTKTPFLSATELDLIDTNQVDTLRKANIATFASSLFGTQEISLADMNSYFLEIFVPEGGRLLKAQGSLLLDLKTQAFINAINKDGVYNPDSLYTFFSSDLEAQILARRPGARGLAPSEQDFVKRVMSRREILANDIKTSEGLQGLPDKYHWADFLRDVISYISKNFDTITAQTSKKLTKEPSLGAKIESHTLSQTQLETNFQVMPVKPPTPEIRAEQPKDDDFVAKAARAAQIALQGHGMSMSPPPFDQSPLRLPPTPQQSFQEMPTFQQYQPPGANGMSRSNGSPGYGPDIPHVSQSAPTQVLYERARQAASAKSTPAARKPGAPSQRRPWTTEEENALMAGLDRVRGPHWSQILAMFGPGGTVNESLKDRNQVQLKDKARNLKLFFLKSGIEVPYYLKYVTGDLKTRAPGQASKNEARDRVKQQGEEDRAHYDGVQGIMALAGGSSGYSEDIGSSNSLPESAQAAYDRVMGAISNQSILDQPLDPDLSAHIEVISQMEAQALTNAQHEQLSSVVQTDHSQSKVD